MPGHPVSDLVAALERLADTIRTTEQLAVTPLTRLVDVCVAINPDGKALMFAETLAAYEWANALRLRPEANKETGEVRFFGFVNDIHWALRFRPENPDPVSPPTDWYSAVHQTTCLEITPL